MTEGVPARGSLRSRGAVLVSAVTLRQIGAVLPPERWLTGQVAPEHVVIAGDSAGGHLAVDPVVATRRRRERTGRDGAALAADRSDIRVGRRPRGIAPRPRHPRRRRRPPGQLVPLAGPS